MSYIGNQPFNASFLVDTFSGTGSAVSYTMTIAPAGANSLFVIISGVVQPPSAYSVVGTTLTFSSPPPIGTNNIVCRYLGLPASNVTTTAYRAYTELTATAGQTTFSPAAYTPGFIDVYRNGVKLNNSSFTATNGSTVVLGTAANAGDSIVIIGFYVSSVLNGIPAVAGSITSLNLDVGNQNGTGAVILPNGTTGQRPSGSTGMVRVNQTTGYAEYYNGSISAWATIGAGLLIRAPQILVSGTSYTAPANCRSIYVECVGGGGGGGSSPQGNAGGCGGGGGGASYTAKYFTVTPSTAYTYAIGGGGGAASSGGSTTFTVSGVTITAGGGAGGTSGGAGPAGWPGGAGGTGSGGDINVSGNGGNAAPPTYVSGAGGGAGGIGGGGGQGQYYSVAGAAGNSGGGGGGACGGPGNVGGTGGTGLIRIWEFT